jgi:hypothetical protein
MTTPAPQGAHPAPHPAPARGKGKPRPKAPPPKPQQQAKAPPPPAQPQKPVNQPTHQCPLLAEKPCDVDKLKLEVETESDGTKKLETTKIKRQDAVSGVKNKTVLSLLAHYDLIIDVIAGYPCREDPHPPPIKITGEAEYHGRKCATQTHPLMIMTPGTKAAELPPEGIHVKDHKIGPKSFLAEPINADFGLEAQGIGVLLQIIKSIWPTAHPKKIEVRAESCGIRARGDGGQQRRNLLGLVRIFRKDTFAVGIKLPPLGKYKHERGGTVTGEREFEKKTEMQGGFGYARSSTSSKTSENGDYEHTGTRWRGSHGSSYSQAQSSEGGHTTRTFSEQYSKGHGEGRKITSEGGNFSTEVQKELERQGPIALVITRNGREFEKELLGSGEHKSLKEKVIDGLVKGIETIGKAIETFNKMPQLGWKFEFSVSLFAGTITLQWGPKALPGPVSDGRYYPVGLKVVGNIAMDVVAIEASISFGVEARALGTGIVAKIQGKLSLKVAVECEIALEEWKPKFEVALKPEASFTGSAIGYASVAGYSLVDAQLSCKVAITMDDGKLEIEAEHGIVLKGTLKREPIQLKGYIKVPIWGLKKIDPPVMLCEGAVLHKFG